MDANQGVGTLDRLGAATHLDRARMPWVHAGEFVDHDRGLGAAGDVPELLRLRELTSGDVDRVVIRVVSPHANRDDVRRSVLAHGGNPGELATLLQIGPLDFAAGAA